MVTPGDLHEHVVVGRVGQGVAGLGGGRHVGGVAVGVSPVPQCLDEVEEKHSLGLVGIEEVEER